MPLNHVEQRLAHGTLAVALQHPAYIDRRQVHAVATQQVLGLYGGQHGVGPTELRLTLVLDGRHGQQHLVGKSMVYTPTTAGRQQQEKTQINKQMGLHACKDTKKLRITD